LDHKFNGFTWRTVVVPTDVHRSGRYLWNADVRRSVRQFCNIETKFLKWFQIFWFIESSNKTNKKQIQELWILLFSAWLLPNNSISLNLQLRENGMRRAERRKQGWVMSNFKSVVYNN
jgi:hypothetical protein